MSLFNIEKLGEAAGAYLSQFPASTRILFDILIFCSKTTIFALRDTVFAKLGALLLSDFGLYSYHVWIVFTALCHLCLFLFRPSSSWREAAIPLRQFITRDGGSDDLIALILLSSPSLAIYGFMSLVFWNVGSLWSVYKWILWTTYSTLLHVTWPNILWFCLINNPYETFLIIAAKLRVNIWQLFASAVHRCIRFYVKFRVYLVVHRDKRTAKIATTLEKYKYSPLKEGEIRLLKLSQRTIVSPVHCELVHVRLDEAPVFETISYTWGTPSIFKTLIINGKCLEVSERVYEIVQDRASSLITRFTWIDSICINQGASMAGSHGDNNEKSSQVQLMRSIYSCSHHTVIWLGNAPDANSAMCLLVYLWGRMVFDDPDKRASLSHMELGINSPAWPALFNFIKHDYWVALFNLIEHHYWVRCWVIQEIAVSKKVILSYGGWLITWDYFDSIMRPLFDIRSNSVWDILKIYQRTDDSNPPPVAAGLRITTLVKIRDRIQNGQPFTLFEALMGGINSVATDPRDNIFALQGISAAAESGDVIPDYNSALDRPFLETAEYLLRQENPSRVLHVAGIGFHRKLKLQSSVSDIS